MNKNETKADELHITTEYVDGVIGWRAKCYPDPDRPHHSAIRHSIWSEMRAIKRLVRDIEKRGLGKLNHWVLKKGPE